KKLPKIEERSFYSLETCTVKLETVKPSEDGKGIILRLYETMGANDTTIVRFDGKYDIFESNLIETEFKQLKKNTSSVELKFTPFEIKTLYLKK
ncbi:MAG: glycosyl hydrolase-related protein, partial [Candidatus Delongbacteria bacterium]|nr:glycosyl hydrolase-related protein [Candidatus Delongbacteria bacterium]